MAINLMQQRKNLKPVQSCAARYGRRHVTRIDYLCNNIALKIVVKDRPM